eukprot:15439919-Alexandrium_andersonii.AAC.1
MPATPATGICRTSSAASWMSCARRTCASSWRSTPPSRSPRHLAPCALEFALACGPRRSLQIMARFTGRAP